MPWKDLQATHLCLLGTSMLASRQYSILANGHAVKYGVCAPGVTEKGRNVNGEMWEMFMPELMNLKQKLEKL